MVGMPPFTLIPIGIVLYRYRIAFNFKPNQAESSNMLFFFSGKEDWGSKLTSVANLPLFAEEDCP